MKVIKTAAMVVGAVALVASGVGAVVGATGLSLATVSAIGTVAGLVGTVATAISPPKAAKGTIGGSQTEFKLDPNAGIPYMMGRTFNGGNITHRDTWGQDNQYQGFVVTYSGGGTFQSYEAYLVDQTDYGRNGDRVGGTYDGWMWNRLTLPAMPAGPVTSPVGGFPGLDADFKMSGHATGVVVVKFDTKNGKKFTGGVPKNGIVGIGERVYDPRQDSTYPGGNGPCRPGQPETYVGGAAALNAWLHALTWAIGVWQNGFVNPDGSWNPGRRVMGVGLRVRAIDIPTFVDAANVADANGWTIGGVVYSIDNKWDVLRQMAQAGGGQCIRSGARLSAFVNAPKVALATVRDADLVGKASVSAAQTYRDRLNGMIPKFRSEAHGWEIVPATPVRVASYVALDGEEKTREWPLPLVQSVKQAGELTAYELVNRREFGPIQLPLFIRFMGYKPGDALNLSIDKLDMVNQLAVVRKRQIDPTSGNVQLSLVSETTAKHAYALGHTSVAPDVPSLTAPDDDVLASPQASDWMAVGGELENAGVKTPAVILTGTVRNPNAEAFLVELRALASAEWKSIGQYPAKTERVDITAVASGAEYVVGVSFVRRGVIGERLQLDPVRVGTAVVGEAANIAPGGTIGGTYNPGTGKYEGGVPVDGITEKLEDVRNTLAEYDAVVADVEKKVADADKRIEDFSNEVDLKLNGASKALADEIARAKGEEEKLNTRVDQVSAGSGYDDTQIRTLIRNVDTARADDKRALGESISSVQSTVTRGGGNRVPNTDFVSLDGWTVTYNGVNAVLAINAAGDLWHPIGENVISLYQQGPLNGGGYVHVFSENFAVYPGEYIQFYADAAAHRADGWISVFWFDANGADAGYAGENPTKLHDNGGRSPTGWERIGQKSVRVPDNAVTARLALRKSDTFAGANPADSYAWFWRPYVGDAIKDQQEWNPYSRGTNGVVQVATNALIEERRRTLAAADKAIAERVTKTEAQLGGDDPSALSARIEQTELAVTDGRFAGAERVGVLEANSGGGGNLLSNTDFQVDASGWSFNSESGSGGARNGYTSDQWWPAGMNALVISQENPSAERAGHWSMPVVGIEPGRSYQASVYAASHRCNTSVYLDFYDRAGNYILNRTVVSDAAPGGDIGGYNRIICNFVAPPGAARIVFYLIKYGTLPGGANSYAWFVRPQLSAVRAGVTEPVPYVPGSGDAAQAALSARVTVAEKAASDGQLALAARASTVEAAIYARSPAALNANANLSNWPDPIGLPIGWAWWNAAPGASRRVAGPGGRGFGFGHDTPVDINTGLANAPIGMDAGWWVFEGETVLIAGTYQGAGMTIDGVFNFDFSREEDTNGVVGIYGYGQRRRWSKMFYADRPGTSLHLMDNWGPFSPMAAKNIEWYACGVRPASAAEIAARKAIDTTIPAVAARVKSTEDTLVDLPNRFAGAEAVRTLQAQLNNTADSGLRTGIVARIEDRASAIADEKMGAVAQTVEGIRANFEGRIAGVEQSAGAISAIDGRTEYYWQVTGTAPDGNAMIRLAKKDGSAPLFYVGANMIVDGSLLVTGTVTTLKVQDNAITGVAWGSVGNIFHNAGGQQGQTIQKDSQRLALNVSGKRVRVDYQFSGNQSNDFGSSANSTGTVLLFCAINGGAPFQMSNRRYPLYLGNPQYFGGFELTTPPAGTVEFFLRLTVYYASTGSAAYEANDILLTIEETKK